MIRLEGKWAAVFIGGFALALSACGDDGGAPDGGGADAAADDAFVPVCASDAECDDGLFCNGAERCSAGRCLAGEPVTCDDGVACTVDECDEATDECSRRAPDEDGDGVGDASCVDAEGNPLGTDCDDTDELRFPGNPEVCDADDRDEDCDPETFGRRDRDADGAFDASCCNGELCGTDCDDLRADVRPGVTEVCDRLDNDCDGSFDEGVLVGGFADGDRDGFGDPAMPLSACPGTVGFVPGATGDDCDDADPARNPGQVEVCDEVDNDCNGLVDDDPSIVPWYADADGDGFGNPNDAVDSCEPIAGRVLAGTDCDDADPARSPASAERCNGVDDDCNGLADFEIAPGDFEDDDGDRLVDVGCGAPLGVDCADDDATSGPGGVEACDGNDNDCDGTVDEDVVERVWSYDGDGDGVGGPGSAAFPTIVSCRAPAGYVGTGGDCDDADAARFPGQLERCDGRDQDCDAAIDEGADCACPAGRADCNDDPADGCEVRLATDGANCGACGAACSAGPQTRMAICAGGGCRITECDAGFEDCDEDATNGCEVDTRADPSSCGSCGQACVAGPGVAMVGCVDGRCEVLSCADGFGDCNGNPADGCEAALDASPHCGVCFNDCGTDCRALSGGGFGCGVLCAEGTADCNDDPSDGCEATVSATACGCGAVVDCTTTAGPLDRVACRGTAPGSATCERSGCVSGAQDCGFGCTNTDEDPRNCGGCGNDCGPAMCAGGTCDCPAVGLDECGGRCTDTASDTVNCGSCGNVCAGGERCESGSCVVDCGGGIECGGSCTDPLYDVANCGACGVVCPTSGPGFSSSTCNGGRCELFCDTDRADCNGMDVDGCEADLTLPSDCGFCGNDCGAGGSCSFGICDRPMHIANAPQHSCLIRDGGGVACWGDPTDGRLGDGTTAGAPRGPVTVQGLPGPALDLAVGDRHSCAIVDNAGTPQVWCWGDNQRGQLGCAGLGGCGTSSGVAVRVNLPSMVDPRDVQAGLEHTCVAGFDPGGGGDGVWCWGDNGLGQVGSGNAAATVGAPEAVQLSGGGTLSATETAVGGNFACALPIEPSATIELRCWGDDSHGQLADGTPGGSSNTAVTSVSIPFFDFPLPIAAGGTHACMLDADDLRCWGQDSDGSLGMPMGNNATPVLVPGPGGSQRELLLGLQRTCVHADDNSLRCRGDNLESELVPASTSTVLPGWTTVTSVGTALTVLSEQSTAAHQCGIRGDGALFCWGDNDAAQLGRGTTSPSGGVGRVQGI